MAGNQATMEYLIRIRFDGSQAAQVQQAINQLKGVTTQAGASFRAMGASAKQAEIDVGKLASRAMVTIPVWLALRTVFMGFLNILGDGMKRIIEFDAAMAKMGALTSDFSEKTKGMMSESLTKLIRETGRSVNEVSDAYAKIAETGQNAATSIAGTEVAMKLSVGTFADSAKTARLLIDLYNVFGDTMTGLSTPLEKMQSIAGTFAILWKRNAGTLDEYINGMSTFGGVAKQWGLSMEQSILLVTTLHNAMQRSSTSGTQLARALYDMTKNRNAVASFLGDKEFARTSGDNFERLLAIIKKLKAGSTGENLVQVQEMFGTKSEKGILGLVSVSDKLLKVWSEIKDLPLAEKVKVLDDLFQQQSDTIDMQIKRFQQLAVEMSAAFLAGLTGFDKSVQGMKDLNDYMENTLIPTVKALGEALRVVATIGLPLLAGRGLLGGLQKLGHFVPIATGLSAGAAAGASVVGAATGSAAVTALTPLTTAVNNFTKTISEAGMKVYGKLVPAAATQAAAIAAGTMVARGTTQAAGAAALPVAAALPGPGLILVIIAIVVTAVWAYLMGQNRVAEEKRISEYGKAAKEGKSWQQAAAEEEAKHPRALSSKGMIGQPLSVAGSFYGNLFNQNVAKPVGVAIDFYKEKFNNAGKALSNFWASVSGNTVELPKIEINKTVPKSGGSGLWNNFMNFLSPLWKYKQSQEHVTKSQEDYLKEKNALNQAEALKKTPYSASEIGEVRDYEKMLIITEKLKAAGYSQLEIDRARYDMMLNMSRELVSEKEILDQQKKIIVEMIEEQNKLAGVLQNSFQKGFKDILTGKGNIKDLFSGVSDTMSDTFTTQMASGLARSTMKTTGLGEAFGSMGVNVEEMFGGIGGKIAGAHLRGIESGAITIYNAHVSGISAGMAGQTALRSETGIAGMSGAAGGVGGFMNTPMWAGGRDLSVSAYGYGAGSSPLGGGFAKPYALRSSAFPKGAAAGASAGPTGAAMMGGLVGGYSAYSAAKGAGFNKTSAAMVGVGGGMLMMGAGMGIGAGAFGIGSGIGVGLGASLGATGGGMMGGLMGGLAAIGPMGWMAIALLAAGLAMGLMGGKKSSQTSTQVAESRVASKIDVTNKKLELINRNLLALNKTMETYILPSSAYFSSKSSLADEFAMSAKRGT